MLTSKRPRRQYASSSIRVVDLPDAQDIRLPTEMDDRSEDGSRTTSSSMPVSRLMGNACIDLVPKCVHCFEKKYSCSGAISSCKVQPRENHLLDSNSASIPTSLSPAAFQVISWKP